MRPKPVTPATSGRPPLAAGSICEFRAAEDRSWRGVVVSADLYNASGADPIVVPLRRAPTGASPYVIPMAQRDPVCGVADVRQLTHVDPAGFAGMVGIVTGATMTRIQDAITNVFAN